MHQRKSKKVLKYFFLLILISSTHHVSLNIFKFDKIQNIKVTGLSIDENKSLNNKLKSLHLGNIFFINEKEIGNLINSNSLIENYEVKKKYPSTIEIKIDKTKFLAKINKNGEIFIIGSNGKLSSNDYQNTKLPFIFGNPNIEEFLIFKKILDQSKFSYDQVENLYFFPSRRWDVKFKNKTLIKMRKNHNVEYLNNIYRFLENYTATEFIIVDARVNNQIIINE
tara:strand:+ start:23 stop:694 length:672 start_codon:yes stop_codon:yes gene_type:complete